jgi:hypothetical protein
MKDERITIFAGHYGSGKTNIAINYALCLKKERKKAEVALVDLDIVNPYFRANDSAALLTKNGIRVITGEYANTNLDAPAIPVQAISLFDNKNLYGIIDLGGDDRGAVAIGRYKEHIQNEQSKNILLVVNCYRPLSRSAEEIITIKNEIEAAAGFQFNGIVNNSNLGAATCVNDILKTLAAVNEVSSKISLPVIMTCVDERLKEGLLGQIPDLFGISLNIPLVLQRL